jgi:hypothetical protein
LDNPLIKGLKLVSKLIFAGFLLSSISNLKAQERCSFTRYQQILQKINPKREKEASFEKWMDERFIQGGPNLRSTGATYTIPVVVHVIHNGESTGSGINISDQQIQSQIQVLNDDFNRKNSDASNTPSDFLSVAGSIYIEFVLAKRDPDGLASNGIVRVNGGKSSWGINEEKVFKALSYWPAEDYLNIWVLNLSGSDIGYASFPVSNLAGLENITDDRLNDGVIIDYKAFGSTDYGSFNLETRFNKGRTTTHEVGHFLGLRHIWGDGNSCSATDYVADTPAQIGETTGCPVHPIVECTTAKMFQNYMDYTDDTCMNLFSIGQISRFIIVLTNSPRRLSLTTSLGSVSPNYNLEASLNIKYPSATICPGQNIPIASIRNLGNTQLTSAQVAFYLNGVKLETKVFSLNLLKSEKADLDFAPFNAIAGATAEISFELITVNGVTDEYAANNYPIQNTQIINELPLPFSESFDTLPDFWEIYNPDQGITWAFSNARGGSMTIAGYEYDLTGALDVLFTPVFDATSTPYLLLQFDMAYARYEGNNDDSFSVYLLDNCNKDLSGATLLYRKSGADLATAPDLNYQFYPTDADWRTEIIPMNNFTGKSNIRLAFAFENGFGNNLYLDQVRLITAEITDLKIINLTEPDVAVCASSITPKLNIYNIGTLVVSNLKGTILQNGNTLAEKYFEVNLEPGNTQIIEFNELPIEPGENHFQFHIEPALLEDTNPSDNLLNTMVSRITQSDFPPLREDFENVSAWTFLSENPDSGWKTASTNKGISAQCESFNNTTYGSKSWLISPVIDMRKLSEASLFADISYATRGSTGDYLVIAASRNCGKSFDEILFEGPAEDINLSGTSNFYWTPGSDEDWTKKYLNLDPLAGTEQVLIYFKLINNHANNLYIDNIEFFTSGNPDPLKIETQFFVYTDAISQTEKITFNLNKRGTVKLQILSPLGQPVLENTYENILNQTFTYELNLPTGIYLYRVQIDSKTYTTRHFKP